MKEKTTHWVVVLSAIVMTMLSGCNHMGYNGHPISFTKSGSEQVSGEQDNNSNDQPATKGYWVEETEETPRGHVVMINFLGNVNAKNITSLISVVDVEMSKGSKNFLIKLNTTGGDPEVSIGACIYLMSLPITITTYNIGQVSSAGIYLYSLGSKRYSSPYGYFILHEIKHDILHSNSDQVSHVMKKREIWIKAIKEICSPCLKGNHIDKMFGQDVMLTADEAKNIGLVDEIGIPIFDDCDSRVYSITD